MAARDGMLFRVLGPIGAEADGRVLRLGPPLQRTLLGALALHHDEVLPVDRLVETLWGDHPPRTATHSLQSYVSGLRSVLGADRIETRAPGYVLHAADDEVDADRFGHTVEAATAALVAGDGRRTLALLDEGLGWWRGAPLADVGDDGAMAAEIARLEELHLRALETRPAALLALGRPEAALPELERLTHLHPLREPVWAQLLLALYRTGRPGDALLAYQRLRRTLADELGTDPSAELTALYEAILVQDPHLLLPPSADPGASRPDAAVRNPFKGLRPFAEADLDDFFGRDELVRSMLEVLGDPDRPLLAVVGPSGSGKSSALHAGLVPTLRADGISGLGPVTIVALAPGADPFGALAGALAATTGCSAAVPPAASERWLSELLDQVPVAGLLVVVIDQFEELFTLVADHTVQRRFLDAIDQALDEHGAHLRVVVAMRADLFDRPLAHPDFGRRFVAGTVAVLPLTPEQLEAAAVGPAERAGLTVEPALLAALVADLADQPGALPLFQYALTELVERRGGSTLALEAYRAFGGIDGAVSRRAEEVYARLTRDEQAVARQLFLRLVHPGEHATGSRRRVPASELAALDVDAVATHTVLDRFGRARLLSFDRDPRTGGPTIELAHDALLQAWGRLRTWVDEARDDLHRRASLAAATTEWRAADEDPDELLIGARLARYEAWAATTSLVLTEDERHYLAVSVARRDSDRLAEEGRREAEERLRRRARRRLVGLAASLLALVAIAVIGATVLLAPPPTKVALVRVPEDSFFERYMEEGMGRIGRTLDVTTEVVLAQAEPATDIRGLCAGGADLVFVGGTQLLPDGVVAAADCPATTLALLDANALDGLPTCGSTVTFDEPCVPAEVVAVAFAAEEASFLAGAAAARTTRTGVIGLIGGNPMPVVEEFRAGFEAGAHHVDPDVRVLAIFLTDSKELPDIVAAYDDVPMGREAAVQLFDAGADVVFAVAGDSGRGALLAAEEAGTPDLPRWVIGVDTDWVLTEEHGTRVLGSVLKRLDVAMEDVTRDLVADELTPAFRRAGLADGWVELSRRGGHLDAYADELDELRDAIVDGTIEVPRSPAGKEVLPTPEQALLLREAELTFTGDACTYRGTRELEEGQGLALTLVDRSGDGFSGVGYRVEDPPPLDPAPTEAVIGEVPDWVVPDSASVRDVEPGGSTRLVVVPADAGTTVEVGCQRDAGDGVHYLHRRAGQIEVTG
jgi:DNA-binding SARP family transcriptional activator/basic membrane lipoprotein Med (substrate-binding protein (PBP1-ABC) superfamily)